MYKNKIIVFGVGTDFYSQVMRLKKEYDIICICDNNTDLHKKKILGFRVITPTTITEYQFDFIKICSLAHTTAIRNQILNLGIPESKILPTPLWCTANSQNWERLKNETKKNRVFNVGNGPSLNIDDLSSLHESQEQSFAFNKIYLAFDQTDYRPSFYMVEDLLVIQNIKEISGGKIEFGEGTLYPVLHKLEKKGFIESSWKIAESGRKRKYYNISNEGEKELKTEKQNWNTIKQIITKIWKIEPNLI